MMFTMIQWYAACIIFQSFFCKIKFKKKKLLFLSENDKLIFFIKKSSCVNILIQPYLASFPNRSRFHSIRYQSSFNSSPLPQGTPGPRAGEPHLHQQQAGPDGGRCRAPRVGTEQPPGRPQGRPAITFRLKFWGRVKNCPRKNMVDLQVIMTNIIPMKYPDYGSRLHIRITDPDYDLRSRIRIILVMIGLKMDLDSPHFYADNFSREQLTNDASAQNWTECN